MQEHFEDISSTKQDWDDVEGKVFIGGLSWQTTESALREYFSQFGELNDVALMIDKQTGQPRGFGFIKMKNSSDADRVVDQFHVIDGRKVDAKRAVPRDKSLTSTKVENKKLFVGGLAADVTTQIFHQFFSSFGEIKDAIVMLDRITGRSRGFGFVTFDSMEIVEEMLKRTDLQIHGKLVEVKRAEPRDFSRMNLRNSLNPTVPLVLNPSQFSPGLIQTHQGQYFLAQSPHSPHPQLVQMTVPMAYPLSTSPSHSPHPHQPQFISFLPMAPSSLSQHFPPPPPSISSHSFSSSPSLSISFKSASHDSAPSSLHIESNDTSFNHSPSSPSPSSLSPSTSSDSIFFPAPPPPPQTRPLPSHVYPSSSTPILYYPSPQSQTGSHSLPSGYTLYIPTSQGLPVSYTPVPTSSQQISTSTTTTSSPPPPSYLPPSPLSPMPAIPTTSLSIASSQGVPPPTLSLSHPSPPSTQYNRAQYTKTPYGLIPTSGNLLNSNSYRLM